MDKLDLKILQSLDWHGRMPINRIAKIVHSNKDVVAYRVNKLLMMDIFSPIPRRISAIANFDL